MQLELTRLTRRLISIILDWRPIKNSSMPDTCWIQAEILQCSRGLVLSSEEVESSESGQLNSDMTCCKRSGRLDTYDSTFKSLIKKPFLPFFFSKLLPPQMFIFWLFFRIVCLVILPAYNQWKVTAVSLMCFAAVNTMLWLQYFL